MIRSYPRVLLHTLNIVPLRSMKFPLEEHGDILLPPVSTFCITLAHLPTASLHTLRFTASHEAIQLPEDVDESPIGFTLLLLPGGEQV